MNCNQAVEYIHSLQVFGINPGLERIERLCRMLGDPQDKLKFVHVAGTNGKGSTSAMLAGIFTAAGYKTGLYTSPYVIDFRERIQINGEMISEPDLADIISEVKPAVEELNSQGVIPTEFEVITAAAFLYFERCGCDRVVLEVGLGGRFDATNIIKDPLACVITSISLDHTDILGDTVEKIAFEKCGIIKDTGLTVSYPKQPESALKVIEKTAEEHGKKLIVPELDRLEIISEGIKGTDIKYKDLRLTVPFTGEHMVMNALTVIETAIGLGMDNDVIAAGIAGAVMPARMELLNETPAVIMDGGHNEGCAEALKDTLQKFYKGKKILAVIGMMRDKDTDKYFAKTAPLFSRMITTCPKNPRSERAETLKETALRYCRDCAAVDDPRWAVDTALEIIGGYDLLVICGSFYLAGDVREYIIEKLRTIT